MPPSSPLADCAADLPSYPQLDRDTGRAAVVPANKFFVLDELSSEDDASLQPLLGDAAGAEGEGRLTPHWQGKHRPEIY